MPELDYKALRARVQTDLQRQKKITRWVLFGVSLMLYLLFLAMGWGFFLSSGVDLTPDRFGTSQGELLTAGMILLSVVGGLSVMFQFISAMLDTKAGEAQMKERLMARAVAEEMLRLGEDDEQEKAKRTMRLGDDGELEEVLSDDEIAAFDARRTQARK